MTLRFPDIPLPGLRSLFHPCDSAQRALRRPSNRLSDRPLGIRHQPIHRDILCLTGASSTDGIHLPMPPSSEEYWSQTTELTGQGTLENIAENLRPITHADTSLAQACASSVIVVDTVLGSPTRMSLEVGALL